jgi:hypothetical protein
VRLQTSQPRPVRQVAPRAKRPDSLGPQLARNLNYGSVMTTRLATIATAQKKTRLRDALFACIVAVTAAVALATVSTAASGASAKTVIHALSR